MCCEDPPPDLTLLGPPPKPPWLSYQLHCDGEGLVLQHEDQSSALPNSGKGFTTSAGVTHSLSFTTPSHGPESSEGPDVLSSAPSELTSSVNPLANDTDQPLSGDQLSLDQDQSAEGVSKSTLNIIAIVLFSLAAVFLVLAVLILWYKRKLLKKPKVEVGDDLEEDYQYLYNFRIRGRLWKLPPRVAMILRPRAHREKASEAPPSNMQQNYEKEIPGEGVGMKMSFIEPSRDSVCEVETCHPDHMTQIYLPYSSLDRRSSTTSGISSDGDLRSDGCCYNSEDSPYRVQPVRKARGRMRRYNMRQTTEDGELGDVEGSVESLAEKEKRYIKPRQIQKSKTPDAQRRKNRPRIEVSDDEVDTSAVQSEASSPSKKPQQVVGVSSVVSGVKEAKGRIRKGIMQVFNKPPKPEMGSRDRTEVTEATGDEKEKKENKESTGPMNDGEKSQSKPVRELTEKKETKSKKRRKRLNGSDGLSVEKVNNLENEMRESNI